MKQPRWNFAAVNSNNMDKEKAIKIQRYYNCFRLAVAILVIGLMVYLTL